MNILNNCKRKKTLKLITNNVGKVVETDDEIICYVRQSSLKNRFIFLYGCNDIENIDVARKFNINKPIRYVFDGLKCSCSINGYASDVNVEFINCKFEYYGDIDIAGDCKIENCIFQGDLSCNINASNLFLSSSMIDFTYDKFYISATNQLTLNDINVEGISYYRLKNLYFSSNSILFENTNVYCSDVSIAAEKITAVNSNITAKGSAIITSDEISNLVVDSPVIACNNTNFYEGKLNINKKVTPLSKKRDELIKVLKKIKTKCDASNKIETDTFAKEVNHKPVSKVLKR